MVFGSTTMALKKSKNQFPIYNSTLILKYLKIPELTVINKRKYPPNTGENPEKEEENRKEDNIESKNIRESSGVRQAPHLGFRNL